MGFLKKLVKGIGKGIKGVAKIAHKLSPALAFTGIGAPLAAGISAGTGLLSGKKPLSALASGALTYGGAKLAGGGARSLFSKVKGAGGGGGRGGGFFGKARDFLLGKAQPGTEATGNRFSGYTPAAPPGRKGGVLGAIGGVSNAVGGPINLARLGLAGANLYSAGKAGGRANAALERGLNPRRQSLDDVFATDNPYSQPITPRRSRRAALSSLESGSY